MRILSFCLIILSICSFWFLYQGYSWGCEATYDGNAADFLKWCANNPVNAISPDQGGDSVTSIKALVISISKNVIAFGALFAIGAIVYSGIQYTTSFGDDEKIKKAKTTGIYSVIGLVLLLVAFPLVDILVKFVYGLGT